LIRRFIDNQAAFIFVAADKVAATQAETGAIGFDAEGATYPHKNAQGLCSFAALVQERFAHDPVLVESPHRTGSRYPWAVGESPGRARSATSQPRVSHGDQ